MNKCIGFAIAVILFGAGQSLWAQTDTITQLNFSQVDYYNNGVLTYPNSAWGQADVSYTESASTIQWLNVVEVPSMASPQWVTQNMPLLSSAQTGTSSFASTMYFNLGVPNGTNLVGSTFNYYYTVTNTPLHSAPASGTAGSTTVGETQNIVNSGVPSGVNTLNTTPYTLSWKAPFDDVEVTWHADMPNVVQERNFCGPGAATNSLHWLAAQNGIDLGQTLTETQTELARDMNNNHRGNWDNAEVSGKETYIADHNLPFVVSYKGGKMLPNKPLFWDWVKQQLEEGEDVELMTKSHWVVLTGSISWQGSRLFAYRDDPFQHGNATTAEEKETIQSRYVWTYYSTTGTTNIGNGNENVLTVVAESPKP